MILRTENIVKDFGGLRAVNGVSLDVTAGQIVGLIGPNGSGKSTLLNVISGMMPPTEGRIHFQDDDITGWSTDKIFRHGLIRGFQHPSIYTKMTVLDNVLLPIKGQRGENPFLAPFRWLWRSQEHENVVTSSEVLHQVEMGTHYDSLASDLSGGQMKLLELARTLLGEPKMILLDEPTAGVAPVLARKIFEQIAKMRDERGITFLIIEHRLDILFDYVDDLYVMHMGELIAHGSPDDITNDATVREAYFGN